MSWKSIIPRISFYLEFLFYLLLSCNYDFLKAGTILVFVILHPVMKTRFRSELLLVCYVECLESVSEMYFSVVTFCDEYPKNF